MFRPLLAAFRPRALLLLLASANVVLIHPVWSQPCPEYKGISVLFREESGVKRDAIHERLRTRLHYRAVQLPIDIVEPSMLLNGKSAAYASLEHLCSEYSKEPTVAGCEVNCKLKLNDKDLITRDQCVNGGPTAVLPQLDERLPGALQTINCSPYPDQLSSPVTDPSNSFGSPLSPFWAQEGIALPEAHRFIHSIEKNNPGKQMRTTPVGVIDAGFSAKHLPEKTSPSLRACSSSSCNYLNRIDDDPYLKTHGTAVAHLIAHEAPIGIDSMVEITRLAVGATEIVGPTDLILQLPYWKNSIQNATEVFTSGQRIPAVVNISLGLGAGPITKACLGKLGDSAIAVVSAGNSFPEPINENVSTAGILVGSVAPDGFMSEFSQEDPRVDVSAPSDRLIASIDRNGSPIFFGGTSGAAPLVTGSVANVVSFLPGITLPEMKLLLRHSAFPTAGTEFGNGRNGAGSLNYYKMIRVAGKLREGWPGNRSAIAAHETYQFEEEATAYYNEALKIDPKGTCDQLKARLGLLRKAAFLAPSNRNFRSELARMYELAGYVAQTRFYRYPKDNLTDEKARSRLDRRSLGKRE